MNIDTGPASGGIDGLDAIDHLDVLGNDGSNDVFLLRSETAIPDETYVRPAFVSLLHNDVTDARCAANAVCSRPSAVQRINCDAGLDDILVASSSGKGGNDASPSTTRARRSPSTAQAGRTRSRSGRSTDRSAM